MRPIHFVLLGLGMVGAAAAVSAILMAAPAIVLGFIGYAAWKAYELNLYANARPIQAALMSLGQPKT